MSAAKKMRRLLIVDTDAGIDDAMALCMAFDAHARGDIEVGRQNVENYQHAMKSTFLSQRLCDSPEYCKSSHLIKSFSHHN